ncbi:aminotransferase, partial [Vibrio xuii]
SLPTFSAEQCISLVERCAKRGVVLKWFGSNTPESYTSKYDSWAYLNDETQLVKTDQVLSTLLDMRLPLTFDEQDCSLIAKIIVQEVEATYE